MEFTLANEQQWENIKEIYLEAFPKQERKPYFMLRRSVKKGKAVVMTADRRRSPFRIYRTDSVQRYSYG